jgi:hypothetical protein
MPFKLFPALADAIPQARPSTIASTRPFPIAGKSVLQIHIMLSTERFQSWVKLPQSTAFSIPRR